MSWPAVKKFLTPEQFRQHVESLDFSKWRPIGIVIHNTASPTLKRWHEVPRAKWMVNLEAYYKGLGWNGGPHLFIDDGEDGIGLFNSLNARGTHSPSFNAQWLGFEHVGDYAKEDDDSGPGLKVKNNGIAAMAIVCARLGIDPHTHIKLHKEDPRTDHDCPGKHMADDKQKIIEAIVEYMGHGGDHDPNWGHVGEEPTHPPGPPPAPLPPPPITHVVSSPDDLNLRVDSSQSSALVAALKPGTELIKIGDAVMNGSTKWLRVAVPVLSNREGWVAARYVTERPTSSTSGASTSPSTTESPVAADTTSPRKVLFRVEGKMSVFGGPKDTGMSDTEGLALFNSLTDMREHLGAGFVLADRKGLGHSLNPDAPYLACRWDYAVTSRDFLRSAVAHVEANGKSVAMRPVDWGPNVNTGRATDLSPGGARQLGLQTDQRCTVTIYEDGK